MVRLIVAGLLALISGAALAQPQPVGSLPTAGGALTGPLTLPADPTLAAQAATKHYVDKAAYASQPPTASNDTTQGFAVGNLWCLPRTNKCWSLQNTAAAGSAIWLPVAQSGTKPLDVAAGAGYQAQFWIGSQLATRNANVIAQNKSFDIWRNSDGAIQTFGWAATGDVDAAGIDAFCAAATSCEISKAYDQAFNVSTGALIGNNATQTPGYLAISATVATGGSGCTNGTQTFTLAGGTLGTSGSAGQFSGTVSGGALSGTLTLVATGSYTAAPSTPNTVTGGGCTVAPTLTVTISQRAPVWKPNTINGHRAMTALQIYTGGDPTLSGTTYTVSEWMNLPSSVSFNYSTTTLFAAIQPQTSFYETDAIAQFGPVAGNYTFGVVSGSASPNIVTPSLSGTSNTTNPIPSLSNAAVWSFQPTTSGTTVNVGNYSGTIPYSAPNVGGTGGSIGSGLLGGARYANMDYGAVGLFNATMSASAVSAVTASLNQLMSMTPQVPALVVAVGDSIGFGVNSIAGNNWIKLAAQLNLLPGSPAVANISVPGGGFVNNAYNFTSNFTANWKALYNSAYPIYPVVALGTNDCGAGGLTAAQVFADAQAYSTLLAALGPNVHPIFATILPRFDSIGTACINGYNASVRSLGTTPIAQGGLGAYAVVDFAGSALMNSTYAQTAGFAGSLHPTDAGYADMAATLFPVLAPALPDFLAR